MRRSNDCRKEFYLLKAFPMKPEEKERSGIREELERRILKGLSCEWRAALRQLPSLHRERMKIPFFSLRDLKSNWGYWAGERREICLDRQFVLCYPWDAVRETLIHEMAHQLAEEVLGAAKGEAPHGRLFKEACTFFRADPRAAAGYAPLSDRGKCPYPSDRDRILLRVQKLLALAASQNRHEAESAMLKAHELIAKHNLSLLESCGNRAYISRFVGKPALRHPREMYTLARLIQDFYFVEGIWVPAYVLEKEKMGRVLEIAGTRENVELAGYVHDFLHRFIRNQWIDFSSGKKLGVNRRSDFAAGVLEGFRAKLESGNARTTIEKSSELILRKDSGLKAYISFRYPSLASIRRGGAFRDETIVDAGKELGKKLIISKGLPQAAAGFAPPLLLPDL
jgi:hypothetical protein